jgi:hypothetical protein
MTLEDLGNLGDFLGGVAVLVTLLYLALQVRQNTIALRTASRQEIVSGIRQNMQLNFRPGVSEAVNIGLRRYPDLPFEQRALFVSYGNDLALFFQGVFALHESGTLEEETYRSYLDYFASWLATPGGRALWADLSKMFTPRMVAAVDARLARGGLLDLSEFEVFSLPPAAV